MKNQKLPKLKKLSIILVGPGKDSIPPKGWGAVEILIWNSFQALTGLGHCVHIINTSSRQEIIDKCNSIQCDFTHIHYDSYWDIVPYLKCKSISITSHNPYTEQKHLIHDFQYWDSNIHFKKALFFDWVHKGIISLSKDKRVNIFALSDTIRDIYIRDGFDPLRVCVFRNSVQYNKFKFIKRPLLPDRSIYLAAINKRKRQNIYNCLGSIDFVGDLHDKSIKLKNYLGPWSRPEVYRNLTKYPNLVLLSEAEAHPIVCMEALCAGLGLVISTTSTANLDLNKPFIDVIPSNKVYDTAYVHDIIRSNRYKAIKLRPSIRKYAKEFDLKESMMIYERIIREQIDIQAKY